MNFFFTFALRRPLPAGRKTRLEVFFFLYKSTVPAYDINIECMHIKRMDILPEKQDPPDR